MTVERMRQLHDRCTRGAELSPQEAEELKQWYAAEDRAEAAELSSAGDAPRLQDLRREVASAVSRLAETANKIRDLHVANEELRREIDKNRQELAAQPPVHLV
jgi:predicted  nucleic acid-binding Zn-ribbon protein